MVLLGTQARFQQAIVTPYRISLEQRRYASTTINLRLAAFEGWLTRLPIVVFSVRTWLPGLAG